MGAKDEGVMKWIRTHNGEKAHVVRAGALKTLCGIRLTHAAAIVIPDEERCNVCDARWRERSAKPRRPRSTGDTYEPEFTYQKDWDQ